MLLRTIAFLTGIITLSFQSQLLPTTITYGFVLLVPLLFLKARYISTVFWFCGGFIWATVIAQQLLNNKLPSELEGKDILVTGVISSIPKQRDRRTSFEFTVDTISYNDKTYSAPRKISLNWYGSKHQLIPDDNWQLVVRLKKPFSYQNPGGFDYEAWMFQNKIDAKGYVRKSISNALIQTNKSLFSFTRIRYLLKQKIQNNIQSSYRAIILALLIGDKSELSDTQWKIFRKTGTSHLIAISGLHIGLIAGLVFFVTRWLWGFYTAGILFIPSPKIAAIFAILSALIYSAMAGFSLPTQRALIMLCVIMVSILIDVRAQSWKTLAIALFLVLIFSPFAVMNPGFWLSFFAVGIILYFSKNTLKRTNKIISTLYNWSLIQTVISIGLMPFVLLFFNESSLISPIANFIVVPIFSFIIVPVIFIAGCFLFTLPLLSDVLFSIVIFVLNGVWIFLEYLAGLSFSTVQINTLSITAFSFACIGIIVLFLPKKFPAKWLALIFFIPILFSKFEKPDFGTVKVTLLDVGQGLATIIQTRHHTLIYDTGPRYSESFDTGKNVVVPFLKSNGINNIDMMIISHGDNDHIGGLKSIVNSLTVNKILTSVPSKVQAIIKPTNNNISTDFCNSNIQWTWDDVDFKISHPHPLSTLKNNNASCVLRITIQTGRQEKAILLTGDIEAKAERVIIKDQNINVKANILIAPHHGSKTSSTVTFINKVNPDYVLYPIGYRNRYHFPADVVSKRYKKLRIIELSTSDYGAITFNLNSEKIKKPELYRVSHRRFWHN